MGVYKLLLPLLCIVAILGLKTLGARPQETEAVAEEERQQQASKTLKIASYKNEYRINGSGASAPEISAESAILVDASTGEVIAQKSPQVQLPPASIAKLMTALLTYEEFGFEKVLTVPESAVNVEGNRVVLQAGEKISVYDLMHGMLLVSANDIAEVFAANFPGGREKFLEAMNEKGKMIGMSSTHFANPSGMPDEGFVTTTADMATLARLIYQNYPELTEIMGKKEYVIKQNEDHGYHYIYAISDLAYVKDWGIIAVKNGKTYEAKTTEVVIARRGGKDVILVLLKSRQPFPDVRKVLEWCDSNC